MSQLDALCLTYREEVHHIQIDNSYFFQVKHDPVRSAFGSCLQGLHMLRFDPAAEPENRVLSIQKCFNLEHDVYLLTVQGRCQCKLLSG